MQEGLTSERSGLLTARHRLWAGAILCVVIAIFAFLWYASQGFVDMTSTFGVCGFKQSYGLPCPGCGITTSSMAFVRGHILESFYIQPAGGVLCGVVLVIGILSLLVAVFGVNLRFLHRAVNPLTVVKYVIISLVVIFVSGWAVTLARAMIAKNDL